MKEQNEFVLSFGKHPVRVSLERRSGNVYRMQFRSYYADEMARPSKPKDFFAILVSERQRRLHGIDNPKYLVFMYDKMALRGLVKGISWIRPIKIYKSIDGGTFVWIGKFALHICNWKISFQGTNPDNWSMIRRSYSRG